MKLKLREIRPDDKAFVCTTLKKQIYQNKKMDYCRLEKSDFNPSFINFFDLLLKSCDCKILCPEDHDFQIIGYIVFNTHKECLVYVYVKTIYREMGLANKMIKDCFESTPLFFSYYSNKNFYNKYLEKLGMTRLHPEFLI